MHVSCIRTGADRRHSRSTCTFNLLKHVPLGLYYAPDLMPVVTYLELGNLSCLSLLSPFGHRLLTCQPDIVLYFPFFNLATSHKGRRQTQPYIFMAHELSM